MDKWFQSKWFIRVISLAFAITLYIFVTVENNMTQDDSRIPFGTVNDVQVLEDVPLNIKIDADQYVVSGVPEQVKVTLEGRTSILTPIIRQLNFNVFIDLRDLEEGEHTVEVEYENLPENVTAYIEPKTIHVMIEKRTAKEFKIDVDIVNEDQLPLGYEIGTPELSQQTVTLISSQAVIDQVAMVKVFLDVAELRESIKNRELPISVYDIQGNDLNVRVEPESITVSLPVERPSKKVPLSIETEGELPEELELESMQHIEEIDIFGKRAILNDIDQVKTKPLALDQITKSETIELELDLPEGTIANEETIEVSVKVNKRKAFDDITIESKVEGDLDFTIIEPENEKVSIHATGFDERIDRLKKTDIKAFINLANLSSGTHQVDLTVEGPKGISLEPSVESVTVSVP